jgi:hypothetical protein
LLDSVECNDLTCYNGDKYNLLSKEKNNLLEGGILGCWKVICCGIGALASPHSCVACDIISFNFVVSSFVSLVEVLKTTLEFEMELTREEGFVWVVMDEFWLELFPCCTFM